MKLLEDRGGYEFLIHLSHSVQLKPFPFIILF